jgi:ATP synthase F1 delta subunit
MNKIAFEYGKALAQSVEQKNFKEVVNEFSELLDIFDESRSWASTRPEHMGLYEILCHENIPMPVRRSILKDVLEKIEASRIFSSFTFVMLDSARFNEFYNAYEFFRIRALQRFDALDVKVLSAFDISDKTEKRISLIVKKITNKEPFIRKYRDPSLLGGLTIRFDDTCIDLSLKGQLKTIQHDIAV